MLYKAVLSYVYQDDSIQFYKLALTMSCLLSALCVCLFQCFFFIGTKVRKFLTLKKVAVKNRLSYRKKG